MPTPHNAAKKGEIAKTVLMPGDPLRAKFIAENFLEDIKEFNTVRNMLGFTGTYKGKEISVMGSGMGMPSIGIYSHELYHEYDVDRIIRIGSAGGMTPDLKLKDLVIAMGASTDSNYLSQLHLPGTYAPLASPDLMFKAVNIANELGIKTRVGNVLSSDIFYNFDPSVTKKWADMGILCVEMESAALYVNAAYAHKEALSMLSISDHLLTGEELDADARQTEFRNMMKVALELA
ncbi:MAG: purine-nucleoside phosphorylase [Lachnospiraceae bacterium]|jgi:purine-nucleoside phosphorylase|nr:purine-nucleoside phosphorylase [Lachnospiraceae bacterium]